MLDSSFSKVKVKLPSKSVVVPLSVPSSIIVAPGKGKPSSSFTVPLTWLCAVSCCAAIKTKNIDVDRADIKELYFIGLFKVVFLLMIYLVNWLCMVCKSN